MGNPLIERLGKSKHGTRSERRVAKRLGARVRPGSGAMQGAKGDSVLPKLLVESKATINGSLSLKKQWLDKITREALASNRAPALSVSFVRPSGEAVPHGDWIVLPLWLARSVGLA